MVTKQNLFDKIGDLLQELDAQYLALLKDGFEDKKTDLALFEATAQYIAAQIGVLKAQNLLGIAQKIERADEPAAPKVVHDRIEEEKVSFNNYFTPPSNLFQSVPEKKEEQPNVVTEVVDEIADISLNTSQKEVLPVEDLNLKEELTKEEVTPEAGQTTFDSSIPDLVSNAQEDTSLDHITPTHVTPTHEKEEPGPQQAAVNLVEQEKLVVNEVIEESKEILIEEEIRPDLEQEAPSRPLTLNEIISQQKKAGVQNRVYEMNSASGNSGQVKDIKSIINLNDKLLFIKDLFNGYSLAYSEAVELLNRCNDYAEADAFLQTNYAVKNRWVEKPQSVEKLYLLIRKRFA
jgi:hypothetical protein